MLETQVRQTAERGYPGYNEVVINSIYWHDVLPEVVEGFVYEERDGVRGGRGQAARARRAFLANFPERFGEEHPLMRYTGAGFEAVDEAADAGEQGLVASWAYEKTAGLQRWAERQVANWLPGSTGLTPPPQASPPAPPPPLPSPWHPPLPLPPQSPPPLPPPPNSAVQVRRDRRVQSYLGEVDL